MVKVSKLLKDQNEHSLKFDPIAKDLLSVHRTYARWVRSPLIQTGQEKTNQCCLQRELEGVSGGIGDSFRNPVDDVLEAGCFQLSLLPRS